MEYREDEYLMLSGIQHFAFCRRQWALIHIEQQWEENVHTAEGELMHKRAHDPLLNEIRICENKDTLRGYEGEAASVYFGVLDELILQQKKDFIFQGRNRRPPRDNVNAMLSFVYTLLTNAMASALETVGLDPYVGFMHADRPGQVLLL